MPFQRFLAVLVFSGFVTSLSAQQPGRNRPGARRPQSATKPAGNDDTRTLPDIEYAKVDGHSLKLDLYLPKEGGPAVPLVVWIHGGGWRAGDKSRCPAAAMVEHGYAAASVEYRLSGVAKWPAQIYDCKAAIRWLRAHAKEYGFDPERIGVWGGSAGGHLVAMLGTSGDVKEVEGNIGTTGVSSRVQAVCDWYGPTDLIKLMQDHQGIAKTPKRENAITLLLGGPLEDHMDAARQANPITYVSKDDPPFLIMHGDQDPLVPLNQSELLNEALTKAGVPCKFHVVRGGSHGGPGFATLEAREMIGAFFSHTLKHAKSGGKSKS